MRNTRNNCAHILCLCFRKKSNLTRIRPVVLPPYLPFACFPPSHPPSVLSSPSFSLQFEEVIHFCGVDFDTLTEHGSLTNANGLVGFQEFHDIMKSQVTSTKRALCCSLLSPRSTYPTPSLRHPLTDTALPCYTLEHSHLSTCTQTVLYIKRKLQKCAFEAKDEHAELAKLASLKFLMNELGRQKEMHLKAYGKTHSMLGDLIAARTGGEGGGGVPAMTGKNGGVGKGSEVEQGKRCANRGEESKCLSCERCEENMLEIRDEVMISLIACMRACMFECLLASTNALQAPPVRKMFWRKKMCQKKMCQKCALRQLD